MTENEWFALLVATHQGTANQPLRYPPSDRRSPGGVLTWTSATTGEVVMFEVDPEAGDLMGLGAPVPVVWNGAGALVPAEPKTGA